ncbi:hypothetical protein C8R46DRAFT_376397 [Mycena filopes]|nr:hypothetical protein C8R46DRAFT_376397 [Mycena filopes]
MNSSFAHILRTNAVPSDSESERIRDLLQGPRKQLVEVTGELSRLQSLIDEATRTRDELQDFIDAHTALISPMRRLPEDILRAVFIAALPEDRNPTISSDDAPLLFCGICKSWRDVALSTPRLWAAIHLVVPTEPDFQHLMDVLNLWLKRSGVVPLDISMVFSRTLALESERHDISPLLTTLVAAAGRWRNVQLIVPALEAAFSLVGLSADDVPLLQRIALCSDGTAPDDASRPLAFLAAKNIRDVTFAGTHSFAHSPVAWGVLTELHIAYTWPGCPAVPHKLALQILRQCTVLETCELTIAGIDVDAGEFGLLERVMDQFSLPRLAHFSLVNDGVPMVITRFLNRFTLPHLRSFHFENLYHVDLMDILQSVMVGELESLSLAIEGLGSANLLTALAQMPLLQELILSAEPRTQEQVDEPNSWRYWKIYEGDGEFLTHLTDGDDAGPALCPQLRRVEFQNFSAVSDAALLRFILARAGFLTHVTASFRRRLLEDITSQLEEAVVAGLALSIQYDAPQVLKYSPKEGVVAPEVYMLPIFG